MSIKFITYCVTVVCSGQGVWLINHGLGDKLTATHTDQLISSVITSDDGMCIVVCIYVATYVCKLDGY